MFTWSPTRLGVHWWEEPAEVILYQIQGWVEGSGATQTVVRNCSNHLYVYKVFFHDASPLLSSFH